MRRLAALVLFGASACTGWVGPLEPGLPVPLEPANCPLAAPAAAPTEAWTRTGPSGAPITALASAGGEVVLVGTGFVQGGALFYSRDAALFRSADRGETFARVRSFTDTQVNHLLWVPGTQRVFAAVGANVGSSDVGAWLSDDLGASFAPANDGLFPGARLLRFALAAGSPTRVWALVQGTAANPASSAVTLYRKDGDAPWAPAAAQGVSAVPGGPLTGLAADPALRDRLWVVDGARLYRSDDGGAQFSVVAEGAALFGPTGLSSPSGLFVDPLDGAHLVIATRDEALLESSDGAATFTQRLPADAPAGLGVSDVLFTPQGLLVATSGAGIQRVTADGWVREGGCLLDGVVLALAALPQSEVVLAGTWGGLSRSLDGARSFAPAGAGLESVLARVHVTQQGAQATAWLASSAGVFRYDAAGAQWERVGDWGGALAVADVAFAPDGARAYLAIDEQLFPGRYGVDDGVLEWDLSAQAVARPALPAGALGGVGAVVADPLRPGVAYAYVRGDADAAPAAPAAVLRGGAGGAWSPSGLSGEALTDTAQFRFSPLAAAPDGALYAGVRLASGAPALMRSDDGAQSWTQAWTLTGWVPHAVGVGQDGAVYLAGAYGGVGVRRSTDRGQTFSAWDEGIPPLAKIVYALGFAPDGAVLAGTQAGVYLRSPGGTFTELSGFPRQVSVWSVAVLPASPRPIAIAATDRGVFWRLLP